MTPSEAVRAAMKIHQEREADHQAEADRMELALLRAFAADVARGDTLVRYTARQIMEAAA